MVHLHSIKLRFSDDHVAFAKLFQRQKDVETFMTFVGIYGDSYNYGCICAMDVVHGKFREEMGDDLPSSRVKVRIYNAN